MRMLNVGLYTIPPKDRVTGNKAIMENGRVNFTMSSTPDTVVLQFTALVLTPRIQEAAHEALDEDGCTGFVQPLDLSVNSPFKDILKQVIDDAVDLAERQPIPTSTTGKKDWQLEAREL